jgi:putative ABC transport system ATP-binding protein
LHDVDTRHKAGHDGGAGRSAPILVAQRLTRSFGASFTLVVEELVLAPSSRLAVVGPSGCGKSTLLGMLSLALRPDSPTPADRFKRRFDLFADDILALWRDNKRDQMAALRGARVGMVPQTAALLPFLTLRDNISVPQRLAGRPDPKFVARLAERLGIADILDRPPGTTSVGQRQRAAVARALAHRPSLVLADEPTAAVHPAQAESVLALLAETTTEAGAALVIATHDRRAAERAGFEIVACRPSADAARTELAWQP